jgi:hypothetical protein
MAVSGQLLQKWLIVPRRKITVKAMVPQIAEGLRKSLTMLASYFIFQYYLYSK